MITRELRMIVAKSIYALRGSLIKMKAHINPAMMI